MIKQISKLKFNKSFLRYFNILMYIFGSVFIIFIILSFTDLPYYGYYYLGKENSKITNSPDYIVILSGNGMPSPDGLIKTYYASIAAKKYSKAKVIISMPFNEGKDSIGDARIMANELILKGVDSCRITINSLGYNTYTQAKSIADNLNKNIQNISLLVVTSPEHMYRSVHTFLKLGFNNVFGMSTFEKPINNDKLKDITENNQVSISLRYNIWSYMNYELIIFREYLAIVYYKIRGWI